MTSAWVVTTALLGLTGLTLGRADCATLVLRSESFGVVGDGVTDDGPAIQRLLAAASLVSGPVRLRFSPGRTYYVKTAPARYVFPLQGVSRLTVDGGGSTFLLAPALRFMRVTGSSHVRVRRLNVDFSPLPFVDGLVVGVNAADRYVDVQLRGGVPAPVGGPDGLDGEQAFFSILWFGGNYGTLSQHYWTQRVEAGQEPGMARVYAGPEFGGFAQVEPGKWRISIPVPGIAHRFGPGPCFEVTDNDTVTFEDVELWSAPWFGFSVGRNRGALAFRRVNIRPKPGSGRMMSLWRDGFHVKGNGASLLWEDCVLEGMNDDAFNISTHSSVVQRVISATEVEVRQKYPLFHIPWRVGAVLQAVDERAGRLLGSAEVVSAEEGPAPAPIQGMAAAPLTTLRLEHAIAGLDAGTMVWDSGSCNPATTLRRCSIGMSCRLQSPVRIEECRVSALLWFYAEGVEGGFPSGVTIRNCVLKRGRGNPALAVAISGGATSSPSPEAAAPPRAIHDVALVGNEVWGSLAAEGVERLSLLDNRFMEPGAEVTLRGNLDCRVEGNTGADGTWAPE